MRYRVLIVLGSIAACLTQAPLSFSDGPITAVSAVGLSHTPSIDPELTSDSLARPLTESHKLDEAELASVRKRFLQAEQAARSGDRQRFDEHSAGLEDYPLFDYLQYQWLRRHRGDHAGISTFLERFPESRYAAKLRHRWLGHLGQQGDWQRLLAAWQPTTDSALNCHRAMALIETGDREAGIEAAAELWSKGRSQPDACDPLFETLMDSENFTDELVWRRFDAALRNNNTRLARYIARQLSDDEDGMSRLWLRLHRDPSRYLDELLDAETTTHKADMLVHAINRLTTRDVFQAAEIWDAASNDLDIEADVANKVERKLAIHMVFEDTQLAYQRLDALAEHDKQTREWQVRAALKNQDWRSVIDSISRMGETARATERWRYWLARAYAETGKPVQAQEIFESLAAQRDYHGYLAAERLGLGYQLADMPLQITDQQVRVIASLDGFRAAFELMALDRAHEAKSQWWHALETLPAHQVAAAARLAQRWQWDEIAIFTIARIEYWDDIELRFPLSYAAKISDEADINGIDEAIVFGLIRRESAFNPDAFSHAGARGLMQLMPTTARQVARELNYRWRGNNRLFEADRNITFGTYYLRKMLDRFNGNHAMALAAYNAGPHRVRRWLPAESVAADIWIETIPIRETRDYVSNVLVYSMIYQRLLGNEDLSLAALSSPMEPLVDIASSE